jgi:hypothetical protein
MHEQEPAELHAQAWGVLTEQGPAAVRRTSLLMSARTCSRCSEVRTEARIFGMS